ncbi:MAG: hypothetical protein US96_C0006G0015 [Candidatus Woesebacteria bacterium GW2011_GWB1_38_5b]|uniref:Bacterial membrane protein YfhO n=1 Tax=Candidatus Woesebacteria bacterium GW2011_GWB1_38_5b TaxID=1618569 RepID=A0A0G0K7S4_9BACT|nr:MAG: hypothetical protein US96_C0006G0015 [Candidatus Woesebacteria bacterium GW2011_GWB1_38_5b]
MLIAGYRTMINLLKNHYFWIFFIPFVLVVIWFADGMMMATAESGFPFYNLKYMQEISSHSWTSTNLGNAMGIRVASFPTYTTMAFVERLGVPGHVIQAGFFYFIFVSSGLGINLFAKTLFPLLQKRFFLAAVLFYWFNAISIVSVWNRFLNNYMFFWALLPVCVALFVKGFVDKNYKYAVLSSLSTVVFSYALTSPVFSILLWALLTYLLIFSVLTKREIKFYFRFYLLAIVSFVLFNFWWLSSFFVFLFSADFAVSATDFLSSKGNLFTLHAISLSSGSFTNTLRLKEYTFFNTEGPPWAKIYSLLPIESIEFYVIGVLLYTVYKFRRKFSVLLLGSVFVFTLFLVKGNQDPFGEVFEFFFSRSLVLQGFRNSFEKFGFVLPLAIAPLIAFTLSIKQKSYFKLAVLFIVFCYSIPFLNMKVFAFYRERLDKLISYRVEVPGEYPILNDWLKKNIAEHRFISLPLSGEGITYDWGEHGYTGVELSNTLYEVPNISYNTTIPFYADVVGMIRKSQNKEKLVNTMPFLSAKYINFRKDLVYKERSLPDPDIIEDLLLGLEDKKLVKNVFNSSLHSIYEVDSKYVWPKFYSTKNIYYSNSVNLPEIGEKLSGFPETKYVVISDKNIKLDSNLIDNYYLEPIYHFFPIRTRLNRDTSEMDILAKLFYSQHLPNEVLYPFISLKELIVAPPTADYNGKALYDVGILGKKAVEIYNMHQQNFDSKFIDEYEYKYVNRLQEFEEALKYALTKDKSKVTDVIVDSLIYQLFLLEKVNSDVVSDLVEMLSSHGITSRSDLKFQLMIPEGGEYSIISKDLKDTANDNIYLVFRFLVPKNGQYEFSTSTGQDSIQELYVDGKKQDGFNFDLKVGEYEVALLFSKDLIEKTVLAIDEVVFDDTKEKRLQFGVDDTKQYKISYDYFFEEGNKFRLSIVQSIDYEESPIYSKEIFKTENYHGWRAWDDLFAPGVGVTTANVVLKPSYVYECSRLLVFRTCGEEKESFKANLRNFKIIEITEPTASLMQVKSPKSAETEIAFPKTDKFEYTVGVQKYDNENEILVFSELYDSGWKLIYQDGKEVPGDNFLVNGYANGWILNREGGYKLQLTYTPERVLSVTKVLSIIFIAVGVLAVLLI